jgi:hypothetical protein
MRIKLQNIYLYTFLMTALMGCRGCSCNPPKTFILDKIVQEVQLNPENTAKIQIEHLEKKGMGFTFKFKKHGGNASYAVRYNLQLNERPYRKAIFEQDAAKTDSVQQYRTDISLEISPDQQHLLIKHLGEPIDVYHVLPTGAPFSTTFEKADLKKNIAAFKANTLQKPANLLTAYIAKIETEEQFANNLSIKETLDAQEGSSPLDKSLLELIGKPLADHYFAKSGRIAYLCSHDKSWRDRAMKKVYRFVAESRTRYPMPKETLQNVTGAVNLFVHGLSGSMDSRAIERTILPQYPLYPYTAAIYKLEHHRTLRKNEVQSIEKNCKKILTQPSFRKDLSNEISATDAAIEFLIQYRDDKNINAFEEIIKAVFQKEILQLKLKNIESEIFFPYNSRFSKKEQAIILKYANKVAKDLDKKEQNFHLTAFLKRVKKEQKNTPT